MVTVTEAADRGPAWRRQDPELVQEWLRQSNLIYGGLIVIGVYMVTPFLTASSLDEPGPTLRGRGPAWA
jgi:hypothetical protein